METRMSDERLAMIAMQANDDHVSSYTEGMIGHRNLYIKELLTELDATREELKAAQADNAAMLPAIELARILIQPAGTNGDVVLVGNQKFCKQLMWYVREMGRHHPGQSILAENKRLREGLAWYADKSNYKDGIPGDWYRGDQYASWDHDEGKRARKALEATHE